MSEAQDLETRVREAFERSCAVSIAILAAVLAIVSMLTNGASGDAQAAMIQANDQWSYFQATSIKAHTYEIQRESAEILSGGAVDPARQAAFIASCTASAAKYEKKKEGIEALAKGFEASVEAANRQGTRLTYGQLQLQLAIVIVSTSLMVKKRPLLGLGVLLGLTGALTAASAFLPLLPAK